MGILSLFRKHSPLYSFLFIAVLLFVGSGALLFIACLWVMFSYLWVSRCNYLLFPDPVELTYSNTILLSIAASCLCVYSLNGNLFLLNIYFYLAYFAGLLFLFMQVCEYQLLCFYISDSFYASSLYNVKLFYLNIQLFYWHFVEIIWIVLYLVFYSSFNVCVLVRREVVVYLFMV